MARIETDPNYSTPTFPRATAATDPFKKEDVQALAAAFSLHDHSIGKGLGASGVGIKTAIDMPDWFRSTGHTTPLPSSGQGLELYYEPSSTAGVVQAYNRGAAALLPMLILGSTVGLYAGAGSEVLHISNTGAANFNFALTANTDFAVGGQSHLTGQVVCNGLQAASINDLGAAVVGTTLTVNGGSFFNATLSMASGAVAIVWAGGGTINSDTPGYVTINNLRVGSQATFFGAATATFAAAVTVTGLLTAGAVTSLNLVSAAQIGLGPNGQYFLPIAASIRYAVAAGGVHSFEFVAGGFAPCSASAFTPSSAKKFKTNISVLEDPLAIVENDSLHGVNYTEISTGDPKVGFIADDWLPVLPEVVALDQEGQVQGFDYDRATAVTFEALKQYIARTDARLAALEAA